MTVRIGINPLSWSNDDLPSLGAETSLETCLSEGKQAGFSGFELGNKFPRDAAQLGSLLDRHGLHLVSGWFSGKLLQQSVEAEISELQPHLQLLKSQGCDVLVYCDTTDAVHGLQHTPLSHRPILNDSRWSDFTSKLNQLADWCLDQGMQLAYHPHMGTVVQTEADIDRLMANTSTAVGLLLDTGHLTYAGGDVLAIQQRHADRICHVHCKDLREVVLQDAINRDMSFLNAVLAGIFTVPGDGSIDHAPLLRQLSETNYSGWLVVEAEQDPTVATPLTFATLGANNLKQLCADAGIDVAV